MKKKFLILLMVLFILPLKVFASGGFSVSTSNITMYPGETKTVSINSNNAVGKLNISSSNGGVASVSSSSIFIQNPGSSESLTITSKSVGTATISVVASNNFATMDEEILAGQTRTITVNVIEKPQPQPQPQPQPNNNNNNNSSNNNNKSSNNNLKEIKIEGYELQKVDNNNYSLSVSNNITSINVSATAEDNKAQISGTGSHELNIGENIIEIVITAENGSQNKINIKVNRKDGYYLEDLGDIIKDSSLKDVNIIINKDSKLTNEQMTLIKNSKKKIVFNYYDENKVLRYSWTIDGSKIKNTNELSFDITYNVKNINNIKKLSNYADGIYTQFDDKQIPSGTYIKIFVGEKYNNNDFVNIYHYTNDKLEIVAEKVEVKDGYITFNLNDGFEYFITMSDVSLIKNNNNNNKPFNIYMVISIVELLIIAGLLVYNFIKNKKSDKNNNINNSNNSEQLNNVGFENNVYSNSSNNNNYLN